MIHYKTLYSLKNYDKILYIFIRRVDKEKIGLVLSDKRNFCWLITKSCGWHFL